MFWCQLLFLLLHFNGFLWMIYIDINGRSETPASGFSGVLITLLVTTLITILYFYSGCYSQFINR